MAETANKIDVVFGDASKKVDAFAGDSTKNILLTKQAAEEAAATFGVFGKSAGLTGSSLADFSTQLVGLASDLSSFHNTSTQQAIEALGAGLRGESEPLRAYGVLLDDASLRQEALRQGLVNTTKQALTPQVRVLAAQALILQQTIDAQGDAARTQDGYANSSRKLKKNLGDITAELGAHLTPAAAHFTNFLNADAIPAIESTGGAVADTARAFADLPAPVKAATGAFVALRIAQATGLGTATASGIASLRSGLETVALKGMSAADAFRDLRAGQVEVIGNSGKFTPAVGRMSASLGALRVATSGAGAGLKRGLSSVSALVGGPWGAAFIAGTAIVTKFWVEHEKAKKRIDDFAATLDNETNALTENSREFAAKTLLDSGALKAAKTLGISLETVTDAALGQSDALASLNAQLVEIGARGTKFKGAGTEFTKQGEAAFVLLDQMNGLNETVKAGTSQHQLFAEALGKDVETTHKTTAATTSYASALDKAKTAVQNLLNKENARRNANLGAQHDAIALQQALADARKEAGEGAKTLDITTQAGRDNKNALLQLADQWNNSAASVKNARGAYDQIRGQFIKIAESMGVSSAKAKELADKLLGIPKNNPIKVNTPGMDKALADARKLKEDLIAAQRAAGNLLVGQRSKNRDELNDRRLASGGLLRGPGTGTSDSILLWGSNGEFMQRKAAVDYYGVDFMRRLNALQIPRHASGGLVGGTTTVTHAGVNVAIDTVVAQDVNALLREVQQRSRLAASDGVAR